MYSQTVRQLVAELPNHGELQDATHVSQVENPVCGDVTRMSLRVQDGRVAECRFQTYGCPGAIAAAAAVTLLCQGKDVTDCGTLEVDDLLRFLGGLPTHKRHGAELAIEALRRALATPGS